MEGCKHLWNCRGGWIYVCGFTWLLELRQYRWQWLLLLLEFKPAVCKQLDRVTMQKRGDLLHCGVLKSTSPQICAGLCLWQGPSIEMHITVVTSKHLLLGCCSSGAKCCNRDQLSEPFWKGICRAIRRALLCLLMDLGRVLEVTDGFVWMAF